MGNKCVLVIPSLLDATASIYSSISESRYTRVSVSVLTFIALTLLTSITSLLDGEEGSAEVLS